jgi:flagellar hook-basal body complex protein FliE
MTTPTAAASAYANLARLTDPAGSLGKSAAGSEGPSFGALLKDAVGAVMEAGHKSDVQQHALASGKANIVDVVTAVSETEAAVGAMVAIRDRVIAAYEDIMKMPI